MKKFCVINSNNIVENIVIAENLEDLPQLENSFHYLEIIDKPCVVGNFLDSDGFFYSEQPYPSWTKNNGTWVCPIPLNVNKEDEIFYIWNEQNQEWIDLREHPELRPDK
jgi:hypothetical protein